MLSSVLPFSPEMAARVTEYSTEHSNDASENMKQLWDWTCNRFDDADKMSSPLQGVFMKFIAEQTRAKRILEIGCFTGYSALAWYEATRSTQAEIITLELDSKMIAASRETFAKYQLGDRIKLIEGPAQDSIQNLTGEFDIVFVDANKEGYLGYVKSILDKKLLSPNGLIMCDNVFARGMTISKHANPYLEKNRQYWEDNGVALRKFCDFCKEDARVDTVLLPLFDGVMFLKWKATDQ